MALCTLEQILETDSLMHQDKKSKMVISAGIGVFNVWFHTAMAPNTDLFECVTTIPFTNIDATSMGRIRVECTKLADKINAGEIEL